MACEGGRTRYTVAKERPFWWHNDLERVEAFHLVTAIKQRPKIKVAGRTLVAAQRVTRLSDALYRIGG